MIFIKKPQFKNHSAKGFTLIEVMIALTILAALAITINSAWGGILLRNKYSQVKVEAVQLVQKKIIEIETEYKNRIQSLPSEKQTGIFEGDRYKNYSWEWEAQELEIPDLSSLVDPEGQEAMLIAVLENFKTYINQSIKEVQVIVYHQVGKGKPLKFVVPFYMVNYDNPISMGIDMPGAGGMGMPNNNNNQQQQQGTGAQPQGTGR